MNKKICVFIGEIAQDYQRIIAKEIIHSANAIGYDVVFFCNYGCYNEDILFAEGEKSCIHLPDCSVFDGIIVTEDILDIDGMPDELHEILKETAKCPVVYLRTRREDFYSITLENKESIKKVIRHFTDDHGFRDICYMSGIKGQQDANERLEAFMEVMAEHDIEVNEHMIYHGDYWRNRAKQALDWFMEGRTTYPEAIICANDYMAISLGDELRRRGVRVPEDVCISGFDSIEEAVYYNPSLTSLEVDFIGMSKRAVEIIDNVNNGIDEEKYNSVYAKLHCRRSCGCGEQIYYADIAERVSNMSHQVEDTRNNFASAIEYQQCFGFDEFMSVADKYCRFMRGKKSYVCFNDNSEQGYDEVENDSLYTRSMVLKRGFMEWAPAEYYDIHFDRKEIIPKKFWHTDEPNNLCVFSMHFKNIVYGYIVVEADLNNWFDIQTQGYLMTLANAIQNSDLHQRIEHLESIRSIYQNDPLTGIYNRRGFDINFTKSFNEAKARGNTIGIASVDMDNLKKINDTYGHGEGDKALITLARALSSVMKNGDFCARIGGDEFAAIINITNSDRCEEFKREFLGALIEESQKSGLAEEIQASVGMCESNEEEAVSMLACIQLADKRMYEEKRNKKQHRV